jgi:hypothetical protein
VSPTKRKGGPKPPQRSPQDGTAEALLEAARVYALAQLAELADHLVTLDVPWADMMTAFAYAEAVHRDHVLADDGSGEKGKLEFVRLICEQFAVATMVTAGQHMQNDLHTPRQNIVNFLNDQLVANAVAHAREHHDGDEVIQ